MKFSHFSHFHRLWEAGLDLVFPPRCTVCDTDEGPFVQPVLCARCWADIFAPSALPGGGWAGGVYAGALRDLVHRAKFQADPLALRVLHRLTEETHAGLSAAFDAIISVPGVAKRIRQRGINLPHTLARYLSRKTGIPYRRDLLVRVRDAPAQTGSSREERLKNLKDVFEGTEACRGKRILVVDDVFTTGATAEAVRQALSTGGAGESCFLLLARTPNL